MSLLKGIDSGKCRVATLLAFVGIVTLICCGRGLNSGLSEVESFPGISSSDADVDNVTLRWPAVSGAQQFSVSERTSGTPSTVATPDGTGYRLHDHRPGTFHQLRVPGKCRGQRRPE